MARYEFVDGSSSKFWEIKLDGKAFTTTYGKIGAAGQTTIKKFGSDAEAKQEHDKLVTEKTKKGYKAAGRKPTVAPAKAPAKATAKAPAPAGGASQKSAKAITKQFARKPKETFEHAIDRGRRWLATLLASRHGDVLREALTGKFSRAVDPFEPVGKPATAAIVARIEKTLGALPENYKRFLRTYGQIELFDGWTTQPPADVISESNRIGNRIGEMREEAEMLASSKPRRWVVIAKLGEEVFAYGLDLPKSPIVNLHLDDGPEYGVTGSFDVWMSDAVDRAMAEVLYYVLG